jgi:hypothetical protein
MQTKAVEFLRFFFLHHLKTKKLVRLTFLSFLEIVHSGFIFKGYSVDWPKRNQIFFPPFFDQSFLHYSSEQHQSTNLGPFPSM